MKGLATLKLFPLPISPYVGISFTQLSESLSQMALPTLREILRKKGYGRTSYRLGSACSIKERLHGAIKQAGEKLVRLELDKL